MIPRSYAHLYNKRAAADRKLLLEEQERKRLKKAIEYSSLCMFNSGGGPNDARNDSSVAAMGGFQRMTQCRKALEALDRCGWERSYHQRYFHDHFIRACARVFWKVEPEGSFAKDHQKILELNGWDNLDQEVLISTPRRFGKTVSVSMFAAAMIHSCPQVEISIYSTCKRISGKSMMMKVFIQSKYT